MYFINPRIKHLHRIFDQNERKDYLRLDLNENPGGLPQDFISEVLSDVTPQFVSQYPETLKKRGKEEVNDVIYTTVDDLLSGTPHWQKAYSLTEEVHGDAQ